MESEQDLLPVQPSYNQPSYNVPVEQEEHEIHLRNYLLVLLNRRWMIFTITLLVVGTITIYSFMRTPVYRSRATVDIELPATYIVLPDSAATQTVQYKNESYLNTQYRLLKSKTFARRVIAKLGLSPADLAFGGSSASVARLSNEEKKEAELNAVASRVLLYLTVLPVPQTHLVDIVLTTPDPRLSMNLANAWAKEYVEQRLGAMVQYTQKAEELLMEQVKTLQSEISQKEKMLQDYSLKQQIFKSDKKPASSEMLDNLNSSLATARQERISAEVHYQALKAARADAISDVQQNGLVIGKKTEYSNLQRLYAEKARLYKPDYPELVRLRAELERVQNGLYSTMSEVHGNLVSAARTELEAKARAEAALQQQMESTRTESLNMRQKELSYDQIQMEIENKKQLLALLLQKLNQTGVSAQMQEKATPTSRIIEYAEMPNEIFKPKIRNNILFSILIGFAGSIFLALLLDHFDRTLKTSEDVERHIHLPFLGVVPYYSTNGAGNGNSKTLVRTQDPQAGNGTALQRYDSYRVSFFDPSCVASEAVKTLRTSLLLAFPGGPPRSVLVTSSRAGEGKTFTSSNLAVSLTELGKRVVLVDADMRNPQVHRVWNLSNKIGLSLYLASEAPIASVLRSSSVEGLSVITSGPSTPRPGELLASDRFINFIRQLEEDFDFVVVDSPPVLPVADSVILASSVKGIIMVVRGGATPRDIVKQAKKKLSVSNGVIAGIVLNAIDLNDPYYYYRYYSHYSSEYYGVKSPQDSQPGQGADS